MARQRGLLLRRELERTGKRWQFVVLRAAPVVVMLLVFVFTISRYEAFDQHQISYLGRDLFGTIVVLAMVFAIVVLPVQTISAAQEERDAGTLDLLALTGISPAQGLWTAIASRSAITVLVMLGCAPLVALIPTLGGVSLPQAIAATVVIGMLGITIGSVAGLLGVVSRGAALAVICTLAWAFTFLLIVPMELTAALRRADGAQQLGHAEAMLPVGAFDAQAWTPLLGMIPWIIAAIVAAIVATGRFRRGVSNGWDPKVKAWPGPSWSWLVHIPIQISGWSWLEMSGAGGSSYSGTGAFEGPYMSWIAAGVALAVMTSASIFSLRAMAWLLPRLGSSSRWIRVPVMGDPVLWRELFTNSAGGLSRGVWIALGLWIFGTGLGFAAYGLDDDVAIPSGILAAVGALLFSLLIVISSLLEERSRKTMALLISTTYPAWRIIFGKVAAAILRVVPIVVLGVALVVMSEPQVFLGGLSNSDYYSDESSTMGPFILKNVPAARLVGALFWLTGLWVALLGQAAVFAIWVRARAGAWVLPLVIGAGTPIMLLFIGGGLRRDYPVFSALAFPMANNFGGRYATGMPMELLIAGAFWWIVGAALLVQSVAVLRKYGTVRT